MKTTLDPHWTMPPAYNNMQRRQLISFLCQRELESRPNSRTAHQRLFLLKELMMARVALEEIAADGDERAQKALTHLDSGV